MNTAEAIKAAKEAMERAKKLPVWDGINHALHVELDVIFNALSALSASAEQQPEGQWVSDKEYWEAPQASQPTDEIRKELESMTRMFHAACADLGQINEALGLDPDDGGAEPILDAIEELKAQASQPSAWNEAIEAADRLCDKYKRGVMDLVNVHELQIAIRALAQQEQQAPAVQEDKKHALAFEEPWSNVHGASAETVLQSIAFRAKRAKDKDELFAQVEHGQIATLAEEGLSLLKQEREEVRDHILEGVKGQVQQMLNAQAEMLAAASHPAPAVQDIGEASATQWTEDDFQAAPAQTGEKK